VTSCRGGRTARTHSTQNVTQPHALRTYAASRKHARLPRPRHALRHAGTSVGCCHQATMGRGHGRGMSPHNTPWLQLTGLAHTAGRGRARRLGGEQRRDDISARITHNRSLSVPSPPPQRRSHTRPPVAKGTSQCECIHVTHSHAEHMRESIWNRHWILQWGGYGANRAVINGATRVVNRVEAQCEWVWTAIWPPPPTPPHTE
jgi:hypothetical protein